MYNKIKKMPNITEKYAQKLIEEGIVNAEEVKVSTTGSRSRTGKGHRSGSWEVLGNDR